jgi:hypothetical protein
VVVEPAAGAQASTGAAAALSTEVTAKNSSSKKLAANEVEHKKDEHAVKVRGWAAAVGGSRCLQACAE